MGVGGCGGVNFLAGGSSRQEGSKDSHLEGTKMCVMCSLDDLC